MAEPASLPVLVLLDHYPAELDNDAGNRFANLLSHVASACVAEHGAAVPTASLGTLAETVQSLLGAGDCDTPPAEVRANLVHAAGAMLAMLRKYEDSFPLPPAEPADDAEEPEPSEWMIGGVRWGAGQDWNRPTGQKAPRHD